MAFPHFISPLATSPRLQIAMEEEILCNSTSQTRAGPEKVEKRARTLCARLNEDVRTVTLPEELLLEIFKHHVASFHFLTNAVWKPQGTWSSDVYGWLAVAHVCRHWRDIVLSAPVLWTNIKATSIACVEAFFERSGQVPVSVVGALTYESGTVHSPPQPWALIFQNSARIERLLLEYDATTPDQPGIFDAPAFPQLRFLALTATTGRSVLHNLFPPVLRLVQESLALETLETTFLSFFAASKLFSPNLRNLTLVNFSWPTDIDASARWTMLLDALKGLPKLEKLWLLDGPPDVPWDLVSQNLLEPPKLSSRPIALLNLRQLVVRSCSRFGGAIVATLLENIEVQTTPALRQLYMIGPPDRSQGTGIATSSLALLGSALGRKFVAAAEADPPVLIRSVCLEAKDMRRHGAPRISIGAWTDVPDSTVPVEGACSASHLFGTGLLEVSLSDSSAESIFLHVFSRLPLSTVQFLMIDEFPRAAYGGEPYMPSEVTWRDTFAHADDVHILSVSGRSAEHLPTALHPRDGTPALLFPKLRHLKLDRVAFLVVSLSDSMDAEDEVEDFWQRGRWYDAFVAALRARANLGKRVVKLTITGTDAITEAEVLELGNYVDDVVWDGRTGPVGTNDEQGARDYCSSMRGRL